MFLLRLAEYSRDTRDRGRGHVISTAVEQSTIVFR